MLIPQSCNQWYQTICSKWLRWPSLYYVYFITISPNTTFLKIDLLYPQNDGKSLKVRGESDSVSRIHKGMLLARGRISVAFGFKGQS